MSETHRNSSKKNAKMVWKMTETKLKTLVLLTLLHNTTNNKEIEPTKSSTLDHELRTKTTRNRENRAQLLFDLVQEMLKNLRDLGGLLLHHIFSVWDSWQGGVKPMERGDKKKWGEGTLSFFFLFYFWKVMVNVYVCVCMYFSY